MADPEPSRLARTAAVAGIAAHVATVFLHLASGLLAPLAGVLFLLVGWAVILAAAIRLRRPRPWLAALAPAASIAFWTAVITFGDWVLGWTA